MLTMACRVGEGVLGAIGTRTRGRCCGSRHREPGRRGPFSSWEKNVQTTSVNHLRLPLAVLAALAAVSLSALALLGLGGSVLFALSLVTRLDSPPSVVAPIAVGLALPAVPLALLAMIVATICYFEAVLGLWLIVRGIPGDT